jgi:hypothetical protein
MIILKAGATTCLDPETYVDSRLLALASIIVDV